MHQETARSLLDVLDVCREIHALCRDVSLEEFENQRLRYLAVERLYEIGGEALNRANRFDESVAESLSASRSLIGLRNRIAHDYDNIRLDILWDTAVHDLPRLIEEVEQLLSHSGYSTKAET